MLILGPLVSTIFVAVGIVYDFPSFLENKRRSGQNKYTTFINSSWGISGQKMRENNFSSMCHICVISRGLQGHSLLTLLSSLYFLLVYTTQLNSTFRAR